MLTEQNVRDAMKKSGVTADISSLPVDGVFTENGLDSLDLFNLFVELEQSTGVQVPDEDVEKLNTIQDVLTYFNKA